jgi:hypothetical protein
MEDQKCPYNGTMIAKATLRIPRPLLTELRERSRREGRSLNETAVRAIERGLGGIAADEGWLALGSIVETPPALTYDADELRSLRVSLGPGSRGLLEDLDWARGET